MREFIGFGIAGNFANHLKQAGEANDFKDVISDEVGAPKGIFPFYVQNNEGFLGRYCINRKKIIKPANEQYNVQAEAEIGLECEAVYDGENLINLIPQYFMAFNDASIRNDPSAKKISQKKNFSEASKGIGEKIKIDSFVEGGICDNFSLTSFLIADGNIHQYGNNTRLTNYCYFHQKLIDWIIKKINTQQDHAVLENLSEIVKNAGLPKKYIIAIGATSYTPLGEERFLKEGDEICIVTYNHHRYTNEDIKSLLRSGANGIEYASVVRQKVVTQID